MHRLVISIGVALLFVAGTISPATAAKGSITDPKGDLPDIVRLSYDNAKAKVFMKMKYAGDFPQAESFYMKYGKPANYQVFFSPSPPGFKELRYKGSPIPSRGLKVTREKSTLTTTAVVPRACLKHAPGTLRFQGVATLGVLSSDQTKLSPRIRRG